MYFRILWLRRIWRKCVIRKSFSRCKIQSCVFTRLHSRPTKGELVAVKPDDYDTWIRCIVINEPTVLIRFYSVLSIDFGRILQVEQITRVPREFRSIPRASVWCKIISEAIVENETLELYEVSYLFMNYCLSLILWIEV